MVHRFPIVLTLAAGLALVAGSLAPILAQDSTDVPPRAALPVLAVPTGNTGQPIAIYKVQGNDPWFGNNKNETTLQNTFGLFPAAGYDVRDTLDLSTGIPSTTHVIVLPGNGLGNVQQTNEINATAAQANLAKFVASGGCLYANLGDNLFSDGYLIPGLLGKADNVGGCTGTTITAAGLVHPITFGLDGAAGGGDDLTQTNVDALFWGFCLDNHGSLAGILPGSATVLWTEQGGSQRPTLAEYSFGQGKVVVHTRPIEFFADGQIVIDNMLNYVVHLSQTCSQVLPIEIDIKPGSDPNGVNPRARGNIPVAILTTSTADGDAVDLDAWNVDPSSLAFGPNGAGIAHADPHAEDVDGDGDLDMVVHFDTRDTGIACGDTEATLTGQTLGGQAIEGKDSIKTAGCTGP